MALRKALLGLAVWLALILYVSVLGADTLEGCRSLADQLICEPGTQLAFFPV